MPLSNPIIDFSTLFNYGVLGLFTVLLLYVLFQIVKKVDKRITEDRLIFTAINKNISDANIINKSLIEEQKLFRELVTASMERDNEDMQRCHEMLNEMQGKKLQLLIEVHSSVKSIHNRLDKQ